MALLGLIMLGAVYFFAMGSGDREPVREVEGIRHGDPSDVPRAPQMDGAGARMMDASYYGHELEGSPTASGEPFDPEGYTAAHKTLPLGTRLEVRHGGESVEVIVNDRGPYVAGRDLDLSLAAAREIGLTGTAESPVRVTTL
ncbi:MAG TPA: septal ring lytic transglycosylase RlpA family protein [Rubrobacteraceae bacterium]|nr:septal ring lytic transglycosylase RlpA family protein [Rubrobacteraceae bacterium]